MPSRNGMLQHEAAVKRAREVGEMDDDFILAGSELAITYGQIVLDTMAAAAGRPSRRSRGRNFDEVHTDDPSGMGRGPSCFPQP